MNCHLPEEEKTVANGNLQMNLYDMNKQIISQMAILNKEDLENSKLIITDYMKNKGNKFYMLLCKDINYYTLFQTVSGSNEGEALLAAADEVIACAAYNGAIKAIDTVNDNDAIEIWVHPEDEEPVAMYLFGYDVGVIKCVL